MTEQVARAGGAAGGRPAKEVQVTVDCADPAGSAAFWAQALRYEVQGPPAPFDTWEQALDAFGVPPGRRNDASAIVDPDGRGPRVFFQRVPEERRGKNRLHLDVRVAPGTRGAERMTALEDEADRLTALGARRLARHEPSPPLEAGHLVMADPEGNEFCLD